MHPQPLHDPRRVSRHLERLAENGDLEGYCNRCGDCCRFAFFMQFGDRAQRFTVPDLWCRYLGTDADGRALCEVYADRRTLAPWCSRDTASQLSNGVFSPRCGYVQGASWLQPSQPASPDQLAMLAPALVQQVRQVEDTLDAVAVQQFFDRVTCRV